MTIADFGLDVRSRLYSPEDCREIDLQHKLDKEDFSYVWQVVVRKLLLGDVKLGKPLTKCQTKLQSPRMLKLCCKLYTGPFCALHQSWATDWKRECTPDSEIWLWRRCQTLWGWGKCLSFWICSSCWILPPPACVCRIQIFHASSPSKFESARENSRD